MLRPVSFLPVLLLAACVGSGDETVVILQNQTPGSGCVASGSVSTDYIGTGLIDTNTGQGYVFTPIAQNYSTSTGDNDRSHIAFVTGANVDLTFNDTDLESAECGGSGVACHYEVPYAAMIAPGGTTGMAFEIIQASMIHDLASSLPNVDDRTLILADVQLVGTLNNGDFSSQSFRFPVNVCNGCLVGDLGNCSDIATTFDPTNVGGVCNPFQDAPVDCCRDASGGLVCPAVGTMP